MVIIAPFLAIASLLYFWLLGEFDINYYLSERPSEFRIAVALTLILVILPVGLLLYLFSLTRVVRFLTWRAGCCRRLRQDDRQHIGEMG